VINKLRLNLLVFSSQLLHYNVYMSRFYSIESSEEKFGLTNQIRRASISIKFNLAEGCSSYDDCFPEKADNCKLDNSKLINNQFTFNAQNRLFTHQFN
jgi:hypothetical protein